MSSNGVSRDDGDVQEKLATFLGGGGGTVIGSSQRDMGAPLIDGELLV